MYAQRLRKLVETEGPFASVYLGAAHDTENATHLDELRWEAIGTELTSLGADEPTVTAARAAALGDRPPVGTVGRGVVAARGRVLVDQILPIPPTKPVTRFSHLPYVVPLLAGDRSPVAHVVVVADKVNGWFRAVDRYGDEVQAPPVRGHDHPVHPVSGGGLAHKNIERRAEETVRHNEQQIAGQATKLVEQTNAELLVVVGEVQARSALRAALPPHCQRITAELDIDAGAADRNGVLAEVDRLLAQHVAQRHAKALDRFRAGMAHGTARQGVAQVSESLRLGQVEALLITDPAVADRTVLVGPDHSQVVTAPDELPDATTLTVARADEALPVAALATAADILVLTGGEAGNQSVEDGIAALLRFSI